MTIRWLHISDVHECDRDPFHRVAMYDAIVAETTRGGPPDLVFFTGDLAFGGLAGEYKLLETRFIDKLRAALPDECPIFTVPGNHDVDRKRMTKPRIWMADEEERAAFQDVGEAGKQKRADLLLPRFEAYRELEGRLGAWGADWLTSEQGSICKPVEINGHKLAVVGINTAWLCQDEQDYGQLTAGRAMTDAVLTEARKTEPDMLIVLGHHPFDWMSGDTEWSDGPVIRRWMELGNAVYLHGHLHESRHQLIGDSVESVLPIQAPSGFQAGDSDQWRNGLMWAEADLEDGRLVVEPLRWNNRNKEYVLDTDAIASRLRVPGQDAYALPIPGARSRESVVEVVEPPASATAGVSLGWEIIDAAALAERTATRPSVQEMSDWFDGTFPRWELATAEGVRPRKIAETLSWQYGTVHHGAPTPMVRLLTGAGGEGKSAALLQTAAGLLRSELAWTCIWRSKLAAELPTDLKDRLEPREGHAWIVVIDDAENVAGDLPDLLKALQPRTDVHMILAAREADWSLRGHTDMMWRDVADFRRVPLAGLDAEDAQRIAESWAA